MSIKKVGQVKADRGFRVFDAVIYGIIFVLAVLLFIVIGTIGKEPISGIRVYSKGTAVFEYNFGTSQYEILSDEAQIEVRDIYTTLIVTITTDEGYNVIEIDKNGAVKVTDADCKNKDCTYMPEIKDNSGIIYCSPHGLRVVPYEFDADDPNVNM